MTNFLYNRRNLFIIGFLIALAITLLEFSRGRHTNFIIFAESTLDFWRGVNPYTAEWIEEHTRFFLYTPVFSVLFTPFAWLPAWAGPFAWNLMNYVLFFTAIFTLPARFSEEQKCRIFLYTLPIMAQSLFSFQYNIPVVYCFLFAFTLLETNRGGWAVVLIMISGCTKIFGIFELALLICYPRFWRNMGYALLIGCGLLLLLPLLKLAPSELLPYYGEWLGALSMHQGIAGYDSIFYAQPFPGWMIEHMRLLQVGSLSLLAVIVLCSRRKWSIFEFRAQALGILMGWVVLFSDSSEPHTYIIALCGYLLWYWSRKPNSKDKILFWALFVLFCIVPIDLFVPTPIAHVISRTLSLPIWVFTLAWLRMVWKTFMCPVTNGERCAQHPAAPNAPMDIICPCYNPLPGILEQLAESMQQLRAHYPQRPMHLIVANDGSERGFGAQEQQALLERIPDSQIVNLPHAGKGATIRGGMRLSKAPYVLYTDIDMPYQMESMRQVIDRLTAGADIVIAVRNESYHTKLSPLRKLMSYGSKMLNRIFLNTRHTDTQGGLKGLSSAAREVMLRTRTNDFLFDTEFISLASSDGRFCIEEVETTLRDGIVLSKMSFKVLFRELRNFFKIAFRP